MRVFSKLLRILFSLYSCLCPSGMILSYLPFELGHLGFVLSERVQPRQSVLSNWSVIHGRAEACDQSQNNRSHQRITDCGAGSFFGLQDKCSIFLCELLAAVQVMLYLLWRLCMASMVNLLFSSMDEAGILVSSLRHIVLVLEWRTIRLVLFSIYTRPVF